MENGKRRGGCLKTTMIALVVLLLLAVASVWIVKAYVFPSNFKPVELSPDEERELAAKMGYLEPEAYREDPSDRDLRFTERELNAMLAKNTDLAERVALDLSEDLISAKVLIPLDEDFPMLGGRTLRAKAGLELVLDQGKAKAVLRGVKVMGLPLPSAWLGGMKNVDLMDELGGKGGFLGTLFSGLEELHIEDGELRLRVKE